MAFLCSGLTCNFQFRLQSYDFFVNFPRQQGDFYRFITLFISFSHISAIFVQPTALSKRTGNEEPTKRIRLEAYTEQSESNPGRSLGITNTEKGAVWKTVPHRANSQRGSFLILSAFRYCLPDSCNSIFMIPETPSWVTLAVLDTGLLPA